MSRVGFWPRLLAAIIDAAFVVILWIITALVAWAWVRERPWVFVAELIVYASSEIFFAGTPGKLILRLRIRRFDGAPAERWRRIDRFLYKYGGVVYALLSGLIGSTGAELVARFWSTMIGIGCFYAFTASRQTWNDRWAHTAVWRVRRTPPPLEPQRPERIG